MIEGTHKKQCENYQRRVQKERHLRIPPQNFHNSAIPTEVALSHKLICSQYAGENKDYLVVGLVTVQF